MHSIPVAILTAEEWGKATKGPKGREQPHSLPLIFITVDLQRLNLPPAPLGTETLCPYQCWEQGFSPQLTTTLAAATLAFPLPAFL